MSDPKSVQVVCRSECRRCGHRPKRDGGGCLVFLGVVGADSDIRAFSTVPGERVRNGIMINCQDRCVLREPGVCR